MLRQLVYIFCFWIPSLALAVENPSDDLSENLYEQTYLLGKYYEWGAHPDGFVSQDFARAKFDQIWSALSPREKKLIVAKTARLAKRSVQDVQEPSMRKPFPFFGFGLAVDIDELHMRSHKGQAVPVQVFVTQVVKGSPAMGVVLIGDRLIAIDQFQSDSIFVSSIKDEEAAWDQSDKIMRILNEGPDTVQLKLERKGDLVTVNLQRAWVGKEIADEVQQIIEGWRTKALAMEKLMTVAPIESLSDEQLLELFKQGVEIDIGARATAKAVRKLEDRG